MWRRAHRRLHGLRQPDPGHVSTDSPSDSCDHGGTDRDPVARPGSHNGVGGDRGSNPKTHAKTDAEAYTQADAQANTKAHAPTYRCVVELLAELQGRLPP
jgi:hypothetical protein